jgi:hypothetical protein
MRGKSEASLRMIVMGLIVADAASLLGTAKDEQAQKTNDAARKEARLALNRLGVSDAFFDEVGRSLATWMRGNQVIAVGLTGSTEQSRSSQERLEVNDSGQDCARIPDPSKRLQCFDAATKPKPMRNPTAAEVTKIRQAVRQSLNDPDSAKFGTLSFASSEGACQTVNAKNRFGGYTGDQQAMVTRIKDQWFTLNISAISHLQCLIIMRKVEQR